MNHLPKSLQRLIDEFSKLPGIGPKSANRLAFYLLTKPQEDIAAFGQALIDLKSKLVECGQCFNIASENPCSICGDPKRDQTIVMAVEEPLDVIALEKTGFNGVYHVLGGVISPIDGVGPDDLRIKPLVDKLVADAPGGDASKKITEVIVATDPSLEGEATALYIANQISKQQKINNINLKLSVTRLARGLPVGGDLEYADELTLTRALEGRRVL